MSSIRQLSAVTSHRLAMGQVVTSVFSVVKELLENALDAGATSVDVRLDDFGLDKIEVRDNGSGLTPEDTAVMGQPHCTSKIHNIGDLASLSSFGFRGEALAAVCASSDVTVATRTAAEQAGRLVALDPAGAIVAQRPVARAQGTTVTAAALFGRQPVRRQLYGSARRRRDDLSAVEALLAATAVSRPELRLALHHNGTQLINKAPCLSARSAALQVLRAEAARLLQPVTVQDGPITVSALLPAPDAPPKVAGRTSADQCFIIVNGRVVSYRKIEKLLRERFSARHGLSPARTPVSVVQITLPADRLDVNLEPNKTRITVIGEGQLLALLERAVAEFYRDPAALETTDGAASPDQSAEGRSRAAAGAEVATSAGEDAAEVAVAEGAREAGEMAAPVAEAEIAARPAAETQPQTRSDQRAAVSPAAPPPASAAATPGVTPTVTSHPALEDDEPPQGVTFDEAARHGPAAAVTATVTDVTRHVTDAVDYVTDVRRQRAETAVTNAADSEADKPRLATEAGVARVTNSVTIVTDPVRDIAPSVPESDGVPELSDIPWDASPESLFGDNFLDVPATDGGEGPGPGGGGAAPGSQTDPWAAGRLLDSQGEVIEPTKLVTGCSEPASKRTKLQPSIQQAFRRATAAAGPSNPAAAATSPTAPGGGGGGEAKPRGPPPAKRPRPAEPGEPEYEPVASQVVRRAGTAFHYYCRDMRRKYLSLDPAMDLGKLSAALAEGWRAALPSVKREFEEMARQDEKRYREDVRKARLAEVIRSPQTTITDFCRPETELRRLVAPLTPETRTERAVTSEAGAERAVTSEAGAERAVTSEAGAERAVTSEAGAERPVRPGNKTERAGRRRRTRTMSVKGIEEEVRRQEEADSRNSPAAFSSSPRLIGPLESHQAWVVLLSSRLLLINPVHLSETSTLRRLLERYQFPRRPLAPPPPLSSASVGPEEYCCLLRLPRDGSTIADPRITASGFEVDLSGTEPRLSGTADCMPSYGVPELSELLRKVASGADTVTDSRPARAVSWLQAEAVRISQGGGARLSPEEVAALVHDAGDLCGECFHGRPLAAPLYDLAA